MKDVRTLLRSCLDHEHAACHREIPDPTTYNLEDKRLLICSCGCHQVPRW